MKEKKGLFKKGKEWSKKKRSEFKTWLGRKVRVKDLQKQMKTLKDMSDLYTKELTDLGNELEKLQEPLNEEEKNRKAYLEQEQQKKLALYTDIQKKIEGELNNIKKLKEANYEVKLKSVVIGGILTVGVFAIALDRENPKATKLASFILKLFPMPLKF